MQPYKYDSPQILNDQIFLLYGGMSGTSSLAQREISYVLAEEQVVEYLTSYLTPTLVTGTHFYRGQNVLELDYGWVIRVLSTTIQSINGLHSCTITEDTACSHIRNAQYGYLDYYKLLGCGGCGGVVTPYQIQVVYESGFASGTYLSKSILQALTLQAQINLNEIDVSLSNESVADVGVEMFINQKYHERRKILNNTSLGNSPVANRVARLIKKYKARPSVGFR